MMPFTRQGKSRRRDSGEVSVAGTFRAYLLFGMGFMAAAICLFVSFSLYFMLMENEEEDNHRLALSINGTIRQYVDTRLSILEDHAAYPLVVQGVMQPASNRANVADHLANQNLLGQKPYLYTLDFEARPIVAVNGGPDIDFSTIGMLARLLDGSASEYVHILPVGGRHFWCMAVPVCYQGNPEGILLALVDIEDMASKLDVVYHGENIRLQLYRQGQLIANIGEVSRNRNFNDLMLGRYGLRLVYSAGAPAVESAKSLIGTLLGPIVIILVFFFGLAGIWGRRTFVSPLEIMGESASRMAQGEPSGISIGNTSRIREIRTLGEGFEYVVRQLRMREMQLLDSIPDLVFFKDREGTYLGCNPPFAEFVGRRRTEIVGYTDYDLFPRDIADFFRENDGRMMERGEARSNDEWVDYPDGRHVLLDTLKAPLKAADGEVIGLLGVSRDITERRNAERALELRDSFQSAILENLPGLVWLKDRESRFLTVNSAFAKSCGQPSTEVLRGKTDLDIWPVDLAERYRADDAAVMDSGTSVVVEEPINDKGCRLWFETFKAPIRDTRGKIIGTVGYAQDITHRKQSEKEIKRLAKIQHELMQLATNFVNIPLDHQDEAINTALCVIGSLIGADRAYLFMYDWQAESMSNTHEWCGEGIAPEIENLQRLPLDLVPDWVNAHRQGETIHVPLVSDLEPGCNLREILEPQGIQSLVTLPLMNESRCIGFVGFDAVNGVRAWQEEELGLLRVMAEMFANLKIRQSADEKLSALNAEQAELIEQMTHLQKNLVQAYKDSQEAARAKSMFLANMSHEIRTPLNAILGYTQILKRSCTSVSGNTVCRKGLDVMGNSGTHLLELINDILTLSRNESSQINVQAQPFDYGKLLEEVQSLFEQHPDAENLDVRLVMDSDVPRNLSSDGGKIRQVLINLVGNAVKFTPSGEVRIHARKEGNDPADGSVLLSVAVMDTGVGINDEEMKQIFDAFEQASSGRNAGSGTGLGLAISRQYAQALGGDVAAQSTPGEGSCFTFSFKANPADSVLDWADGRPVVALAEEEPERRLLLVEDDRYSLEMLDLLLGSYGFLTETVESGYAALEILKKDVRFDAVLLDKKMPGMGGVQVLKHIREEQALDHIPVIFMTASVDPDDQSNLIALGASGFMQKPLQEELLLKEIQRVVGVCYSYEDQQEGPANALSFVEARKCAAALPADLHGAFRGALRRGHVHGLNEAVQQMTQAGASVEFAAYLRDKVNSYDYKILNQIFG